jgi:hypothetical protein
LREYASGGHDFGQLGHPAGVCCLILHDARSAANCLLRPFRARRYFPWMVQRRILPQGFIEPCIPTLAPSHLQVPIGCKHDGYRLIVRREGEAVRLFTRRGYDWTDRYPAIAAAAAKLRAKSFTLDGEARSTFWNSTAGPPGAAARRAQGEAAGARARGHRPHRRGRRRGVPSCLQDGPGGHRLDAADFALPVRPVPGLAQGQKPGQPGDAARAGGRLVTAREAIVQPLPGERPPPQCARR